LLVDRKAIDCFSVLVLELRAFTLSQSTRGFLR
jgi:hypothetical protein